MFYRCSLPIVNVFELCCLYDRQISFSGYTRLIGDIYTKPLIAGGSSIQDSVTSEQTYNWFFSSRREYLVHAVVGSSVNITVDRLPSSSGSPIQVTLQNGSTLLDDVALVCTLTSATPGCILSIVAHEPNYLLIVSSPGSQYSGTCACADSWMRVCAFGSVKAHVIALVFRFCRSCNFQHHHPSWISNSYT